MSRWRLEQARQGRAVIRVVGSVSGADAPELVEAVRHAVALRIERVEVDFARASGAIDVLAARMLEALSQDSEAGKVDLTGLTGHHRRLLDYLGLHPRFAHGGPM